MTRLFRLFCVLNILLACIMVGRTEAGAQEITFVRIGTGAPASSLFPVGGVIANAISYPPGARSCDRGGTCSAPGLIAVATSTAGSLANIEGLARGDFQLAVVQADIAYRAFHGTGPFAGTGAVENLRAVAMLFPQHFQLVTRRDTDIETVNGLRGKRVSLGEPGSGSREGARLLLGAYGLSFDDLEVLSLRPGAAADRLEAGEIDAMFVIDGAPAAAIDTLARTIEIALVPIAGNPARRLAQAQPFLSQSRIEGDVYAGLGPVDTLEVGAILVASADLHERIVYGLTRALWHRNNRPLFESGHPSAREISLEKATRGLGIPLHAGASAYYFDSGLLN